MGLAGRVARLALLARAVQVIGERAEEPAGVRVLGGRGPEAVRLREVLGLTADDDLTPHEGILVAVATPGADLTPPARAVGDRIAGGGRALVLMVGDPAERAALEAALLAHPPITVAAVAHVPTLEGPEGAAAARRAVVRALGTEGAVSAARRLPALRPAAGREVTGSAARIAAVLGAVDMLPATALPQVQMVSRLAAANGRPANHERVAEVAAVLAAGLAWRFVARNAGPVARVPRSLARAGVAYGATVAIARVTDVWLARLAEEGDGGPGGDLIGRARSAVDRARKARKGRS